MSRRTNNVMASAVFVVAFCSLIPVSSGADFSATAPARIDITIEIPQPTPESVAPVAEQPIVVPAPVTVPDPIVATPKPVAVQPAPAPAVVAKPAVAEPAVAQPVAPEPVVVPEPVLEAPVEAPVVAPMPQPQPEPQDEPAVVEEVAPVAEVVTTAPEPLALEASAPLELEGSINEEVSQ